MKKWSDEEIIVEVGMRAMDSLEVLYGIKEGKRSGREVIWIGFIPWSTCFARSGVTGMKAVYGLKAEIVTYLLKEDNEIIRSAMVAFDNGYPLTPYPNEVDLDEKCPKSGIKLRDAMKGRSVDWENPTGMIMANEIVDSTRKDRSFKLWGVSLYINDLRRGLTIPDDDLGEQLGYQYDLMLNKRIGFYPMPQILRRHLLMGKNYFVSTMMDVRGAHDVVKHIDTLRSRYKSFLV